MQWSRTPLTMPAWSGCWRSDLSAVVLTKAGTVPSAHCSRKREIFKPHFLTRPPDEEQAVAVAVGGTMLTSRCGCLPGVALKNLLFMPRATNNPASRARRKKIMLAARGYFGARSKVYTVAKNTLEKGWQYAFRDRK